jgi:class 3 adenylate cyclase
MHDRVVLVWVKEGNTDPGMQVNRDIIKKTQRRAVMASEPSLPTGTITFLFTDIQGSTPLWEREPEKMAEALQIHNTALRQAVEVHGGAVFKTVGDAFQATFTTAPQALKAAIQAWEQGQPEQAIASLTQAAALAEPLDYL